MEFICSLIDNFENVTVMSILFSIFFFILPYHHNYRAFDNMPENQKAFWRLGQKIAATVFTVSMLLLLFFESIKPMIGIGGYCLISSWIHKSSPEYKQLFEAIHNHDLNRVKELFVPEAEKARDDKYRTPLHVALREGNEEIILFLIRNSKDLNQKDGLFFTRYTPLHYAIFYSEQVIEELLKRKANISARGYNGETPLEIACRFNRTDAALLLMERGKNLIKHDEFRPIYWSVINNNLTILKSMISHGFDVNGASEGHRDDGEKAIHLAAQFNRTDIIELLAANGANIRALHRIGKGRSETPYEIAVKSGSKEAAEILVRLGANKEEEEEVEEEYTDTEKEENEEEN